MTSKKLGAVAASIRSLRHVASPVTSQIGNSAVVLAYHDIVPNGSETIEYMVDEDTFISQIETVRTLGYTFRRLTDLSADLLADRPVAGCAAIVFDDALVGVYDIAMPYLDAHKIPWTLLPVTDRLGVTPAWWPGANRTMTREEVMEAVDAGADLCAHTTTHISLPDVDADAAFNELVRSREALSELSGREVVDLCYPFGHQDAQIREMAKRAGYRTGWTFTNGRCSSGDDPFKLKRMAMRNDVGELHWLVTLLRPKVSWPPVQDLKRGSL